MRHPQLLALLGCLLAGAGCSTQQATADNTRLFAEEEDKPEVLGVPAPDAAPPVTHGALGRSRTAQLDEGLQAILQVTLPEIASLKADLDTVVSRMPPPLHLATTDPVLKTWRQSERDVFQATVDNLYAEAEKRLAGLQEAALAEGLARARELAPETSPLDTGPTGDGALDTALETFTEVVQDAVSLSDLGDRRGHDRRLRVELFETFSTFGQPQAEATMGGRLLLFVGGDETSGAPAALLAFRSDDGSDPRSRSFSQVFRHRIMRGGSLVKDLGWRPAPVETGKVGQLRTEVLEHFLLAPDVHPTVDTTSPGYDQLRDMRIVVDAQTAVFDDAGKLLGGVDWRLEYQVSARGALTWQIAGGRPVFDPYCAEVLRTLAVP